MFTNLQHAIFSPEEPAGRLYMRSINNVYYPLHEVNPCPSLERREEIINLIRENKIFLTNTEDFKSCACVAIANSPDVVNPNWLLIANCPVNMLKPDEVLTMGWKVYRIMMMENLLVARHLLENLFYLPCDEKTDTY